MMSRISGGLRVLLAAMVLFGAMSLAHAAEKVTVMIRVDDLFSINSPVKPVEIDGFLRVAEKHGARARMLGWKDELQGGDSTRG